MPMGSKKWWRKSAVPTFTSDEAEQVIAVVVVTCGDFLLIGKRRDSGKWAIPGGHVEDRESMEDAARREMTEETGIAPAYLHYVKSWRLLSERNGKRLVVHIYHTELGNQVEATGENDPDQEVKKWKWVDVSKGLPDKYRDNLHRDLDLGLIAMGIL